MKVDTLVQLKNLDNVSNGIALVCVEKKAWYLYNANSFETADDDLVVQPTTITGRWLKMNNTSNVYNSVTTHYITTTPYEITFDTDVLELVIDGVNPTINLPTVLPNKNVILVVQRINEETISGWDTRLVWKDDIVYDYSTSSVTLAIIELVCINDTAYVIHTVEF